MNNVDKPELVDQPAPVVDEMLDIPAHFHPVVTKYGRPLFQLVMRAGVANSAAEELRAQVVKHASRRGLHAVFVLSRCFSEMANDYALSQGWTEELIAQVDRDIQLAHRDANRVLRPGSAVILDS